MVEIAPHFYKIDDFAKNDNKKKKMREYE